MLFMPVGIHNSEIILHILIQIYGFLLVTTNDKSIKCRFKRLVT